MAYSFTEKKRIRKNFGKQPGILQVPYLLGAAACGCVVAAGAGALAGRTGR